MEKKCRVHIKTICELSRGWGAYFLKYSGTPLIRPPTGHGNVAVLTGWPYKRGRVKFHDWSTSSDVLTDTYHNLTEPHQNANKSIGP